ncbi:MAG: hypothetical protein HN833_01775 [Elusimicrobiaceae bacterium]|nr:hypothetical protein [Elusimicrobiaceae bacterium]MBT3955629.1 hypothetical protein [Elusimicrobiaceae bacterium]MBT4008743.1 hypothetical protein [Elusimicrobiaceae bacterium]MBT4402784.1 hypothetical protein [Elusimicrobiaceae bacterium]MBT4439581.1 hypothetical protein [Elusimicrobiaceae bacterium]
MQEKIKHLELLVNATLERLEKSYKETSSLKNRVKYLESSIAKLSKANMEIKELKEWKKDTKLKLKKVFTKVNRELEKSQKNKLL